MQWSVSNEEKIIAFTISQDRMEVIHVRKGILLAKWGVLRDKTVQKKTG
jgi:hypothetical protein